MIDPRAKDETARMGLGTKLILGGFAIGAVTMLALIALSFIVPRAIDRAIETYTDSARAVPTHPVATPEEHDAAQARVDDYSDKLDKHEAKEPFVLTEREVNALLADAHPKDEDAQVIDVALLPGQIRARVSLRLTQTLPLGPWTRDLNGRYLNGTATLDAAVRNGNLELNLAAFDVKGRALPERVLQILREEIDRSGALTSDDVQDFLKKVGAVEFTDGKVTITPR